MHASIGTLELFVEMRAIFEETLLAAVKIICLFLRKAASNFQEILKYSLDWHPVFFRAEDLKMLWLG